MKAGDKVVYIRRSLPEIGLMNGKIYTILSTEHCGGCKDSLAIDVGFTQESICYCEVCNTITCIDDRRLFHNSGFKLLDEETEILKQIENKTLHHCLYKPKSVTK